MSDFTSPDSQPDSISTQLDIPPTIPIEYKSRGGANCGRVNDNRLEK